MATARKRRIRLLGPHAFGVIRTDIGLNATMGAAVAHPGRLALIAQSGAVCTAMLNFATPLGIGFSTGGGAGLRPTTSASASCSTRLVRDPGTDGILLYVESVRDARRFVSALRAAARTKPVVVLRAGRSKERETIEPGAPSPDAVFDAAMKRAGTVRVMTYTQLFAAARILAMGRIPRSDRLAIVTNGRGPGTLAADTAAGPRRSARRAHRRKRRRRSRGYLARRTCRASNPVNVRGDASPALLAAAVATTLRDPNVDAVLALHVDRPLTGATDAARAVAAAARAPRSRCSARGSAPSSGATCATRCEPAASRISTRRKTRSRLSRFSPPIGAIRRGCSKCRRRNPSRAARYRGRRADPRRRREREPDAAHRSADAAAACGLRPAGDAGGCGRHAQGGACGGAQAGLSGHAEARCVGASREVAAAARAHEPARRPDADARVRRDAGRRAARVPAPRRPRRRHRPQGIAARRARTTWPSPCTPMRCSGRSSRSATAVARSPRASASCCCRR